jgi:RND family efflux transporter MFP subunit
MKRWFFIAALCLTFCFALSAVVHLHGKGAGAQEIKKESESVADIKSSKPETSSAEPSRKALPVVVAATVRPSSITESIELTGSVVASRVARAASPGEGPVQDCRVLEGDSVRRGDRILTIGRNKAVAAQVIASEAALKEQVEDLRRTEQLVQSGAIPGAQLDTVRTKYESARAQLMKARESTEDFVVTAPWDGIVSKVHVKDGDYVAPRSPVVEIFDPKSLVVRFAVPEAQSTKIRKGMDVSVQLDAHPGKTFKGMVSRVYPELDVRMRTRAVEAEITGSVELVPGMFARIRVILKTERDAIVVPVEAIILTPKGERGIFIAKDGRAQRRSIMTGIEEGGRVQILEGIALGDEVIVSGSEKLKDGSEIQIQPSGERR